MKQQIFWKGDLAEYTGNKELIKSINKSVAKFSRK